MDRKEIEALREELANNPLDLEHYIIQSFDNYERANRLAIENVRLRDFHEGIRKLLEGPVLKYEDFYNGVHEQAEKLKGDLKND